jgi:hypothetical protein
MSLTKRMNRAFRFVWVLAANGFVASQAMVRLSAALSSRESRDLEVWIEIILEVLLPITGIILEAVRWKSAKWWNIGCLTLAACFWLAEAVWWRSDPFFGVLLIISFGLFVLAALTAIIYRATKAQEAEHEPLNIR